MNSINNDYAIVFPGQGSQSVGMMTSLHEDYPVTKEYFDEASSILGYDLWEKVTTGPESELNQTAMTQPALLVAGYSTWKVWQTEVETKPSVLAGHSLGEYTALVCAGVIQFSDAVKLVAERGKCMQEAVPEGEGAMAALLGLEDEVISEICNEVSSDQIVSPANFNSPGQIVIAGNKQAVEKAIEQAKEAGAKRALLLPVSVPSHCALMTDAAEKFSAFMNETNFNDAVIPVIQNVDAQERTEAEKIKEIILQQLYLPVRWVDVVKNIIAKDIDTIIECGPGKVLSGLNKRIERSLNIHCLQDKTSINKAMEQN